MLDSGLSPNVKQCSIHNGNPFCPSSDDSSPCVFSHGIQMSEVSEGQRSGELWRLSWQGWLFTGSILREEQAGMDGESAKQRGRARRRERSRRAIFTVFPSKSPCANRNAYVGLCNLRPSRHASPGLAWSWRLTYKCEDGTRWGGGHIMVGLLWDEQRNTVTAYFECLLSNQQLQAVFIVLTSMCSINMKWCVWFRLLWFYNLNDSRCARCGTMILMGKWYYKFNVDLWVWLWKLVLLCDARTLNMM